MIIKPETLRDKLGKIKKGEANRGMLSTGFKDVDDYMKLCKSYLAIISGYPGSGKSEWLDAVLVNMTIIHDWKILYYSPENHPTEAHMAKIAEKFIGKGITFFDNKNIDDAMEQLNKSFTWMYPENPELDNLLNLASVEAETNGLDCLVIDPWNAVTHHRTGMLHEYLSEALSKIIRFARNYEVFVAVVAHPTKPQKDKDGTIPVPTLYDISDGAMWRNKCEYGIIVHRPDMSKNQMQLYVQKLKNKHFGKLGMCTLDYDWISGRFKCLDDKEFLLPNQVEPPF